MPGKTWVCLLAATAVLLGCASPQPLAEGDVVAMWTLEADRLGRGNANWRTLAIMHRAMHDAANAAWPIYARWHPAEPGEPRADPGLPAETVSEAALAAAARRVLVLLHPDQGGEIGRVYARAIARVPAGPARNAGTALGEAVADAAVRRRANDGFASVRLFPTAQGVGGWRLAPREFLNSGTNNTAPFVSVQQGDAPPPPAVGSPQSLRELNEVRAIGGLQSNLRTRQQSEAAAYWYYQSSQRGFIHLGLALLAAEAPPRGFVADARLMSQLASAMADSAILIWREKERFLYWRPVTAIQTGLAGAAADPTWLPAIETPPHPEYPSGHASDCFAGAVVLQAAFPAVAGPVTYVKQPGPSADAEVIGMGQHSRAGDSGLLAQRAFMDLGAMAEECAQSRIWAGAHFRAAVEEARRVGRLVAGRSLGAVPALRPGTESRP